MNNIFTIGLLFYLCLPTIVAGTIKQNIEFNKDIQPIFSDNCFHCHGPDANKREADLRLDTFAGATEQREHGAAIVPGNASKSLIIKRMTSDDSDRVMPPPDANRHVTKEQIALLRKWIDDGAQWSQHWSFVKPQKPKVPEGDQAWGHNPIDYFIDQNFIKQKLRPNPQADKRTLLRRLSLDLTGLPPTQKTINAFLADNDINAYEKQVDRLLNNTHYGERMAWPWLDASRYADTNGYQGDNTRTMWPWRDWVIKAFNDNMPFDQFTIEQVAGDMLPDATFDQKLATAYLRNHMINGEGGRIAEENRIEYVFDQLETVGTTFLGLTFNCCRCHDHKYDPISQKDYYSFSAFFNKTPVTGKGYSGHEAPIITIPPAKEEKKKQQQILKESEDQFAALTNKLTATFASLAQTDIADTEEKFLNKNKEYLKLKKAVAAQKKVIANLGTKIMVMHDDTERKTYVLNTGNYSQPEDEVFANTPAVLPPLPQGVKYDRLALANWLVSKENPLTARVIVNRFWAQVFGTGLIKTTENFGIQGERPKNQALLDWLATEFIDSQWNVKHMIRLMVTSATYRQSAQFSDEKLEVDPYNRYLARGARYRMPSWMIRDQALFASGLLNEEMGGAGVNPYQPAGVWADMTFGKIKYKQDEGDKVYRRSLYTFWRRIVAPTMFFDIAKRQTCEVKSKRTNTPLHALVTMNDIAYVEAGRALAVSASKTQKNEQVIQQMFVQLLGRAATLPEMKVMQNSLIKFTEKYQESPTLADDFLMVGQYQVPKAFNKIKIAALSNLALMMLNLDETLNKE